MLTEAHRRTRAFRLLAERFLFPPVTRPKVKRWAADNAYTLILMAGLFVLTWVGLLTVAIWK